MKKVNHWINGKNVAGNDYFQTTNPATGEVLADVASGGEAEINQAVNIFLATHRISCDDFSFNIQHVKKFWDSCNLIRFLIRLDLSDDQTVHC